MKKLKPTFLSFLCLTSLNGFSQIAANYEVGTWKNFKTAAVSYTFDDNCSGQPNAIKEFDNYGYKTTLFTVTNWSPNWSNLKTWSSNGHEVASHTVSHPSSLATMSTGDQDNELKNSQNTIKSNVPTSKCETIAYPNCNTGDINTIKKYYIAGRTCSGQIISSSPNDFYNLSSIIMGSQGTTDFNGKVDAAKNSKGWCVFLMHGIDNDGGYSPTPLNTIKSHLQYMNTNKASFWIGTFANVAKYIKERNGLSITETAVNSDSLRATVADNLDNTVYDVAVTIRRALPTTWQNARVRQDGKLITSSIETVNNKKYVMFDAVPDKGIVTLANPAVLTDLEEVQKNEWLSILPNPFNEHFNITTTGSFHYAIYSMEGREIDRGDAVNEAIIGGYLTPGVYVLKVYEGTETKTTKIIKK